MLCCFGSFVVCCGVVILFRNCVFCYGIVGFCFVVDDNMGMGFCESCSCRGLGLVWGY